MAVRAPTGHEDLIHDAQLDYYGLRLATCSSDRLIKIFDVIPQSGAAPKVQFSCDLAGHTGPVWEIAWAHPRWGTLLASCSYDASVIIHRLNEAGAWEESFRYAAKGSVNSIEWCPYEYGLALACASSDGHVYILRCDVTTGEWRLEKELLADKLGCNSVTWAPYGALGSLSADGKWILRIAEGGADRHVKIFRCEWDPNQGPIWSDEPEASLEHHQDWVRDVAWAPSIGLPYNLLASGSEDGSVVIWSQESAETLAWSKEVLPDFKAPVWRVAWSVTGSLLAVSAGDSDVSLWRESLEDKRWVRASEIKDKIPPRSAAPAATSQPEAPPAPSQANKPASPRSTQQASAPQLQQQASVESVAPAPEPLSEQPPPSTTWDSVPKDEAPAEKQWPEPPQEPANEVPQETSAGENAQQEQPSAEQPGEVAATTTGWEGHQEYTGEQAYDPNQQHYDQQAYDQQGYDPAAYGQEAYDAQQYGYDPNANYEGQDYQAQGYDPNQYQGEYDPNQQYYAQGEYDPNAQYYQTGGEGWDQSQAQWDPAQQQWIMPDHGQQPPQQ